MKYMKLLMALSIGAPALQVKAADLSGYPYLAKSGCKQNINIPENSGGILFNKGCTVGFVFPERIGKATLTPRPSSALILCESYKSMLEEYDGYRDVILELQKKLKRASADEVAKLAESISKMQVLRQGAKAELDNIEAMQVNVLFENSGVKMVNEAVKINPNAVAAGMVFQQAQIAEGRLSYIIEDPNKEKAVNLKSVLSTSVPGYNHKEIGNIGEVEFNGAITGELALTLSGACPFVDKVQEGKRTFLTVNKDKLNRTITANYTYAVPVQSSFGYEAELDVKKAMDQFIKEAGVNRKFSTEKWGESLAKLQTSEIVKIHKWNLEGKPEGNVVLKDITERFSKRFLEILEENKVLKREIPGLVVNAPGEIPVTHTGVACHRSSSFFGFRTSLRCNDIQYVVQSPVAGFGDIRSGLENKMSVLLKEAVEENSIIYRKNTATFNLETTQPVLIEITNK